MPVILHKIRDLLRSQEGFTMLLALSVMLVTSLLLVTGYAATNGDIGASHRDTVQKQAYYAALAGVQRFEYQMQNNPNYWQTCAAPANTVPEEAGARYEVEILPAHSAPTSTTKCETSNPFGSAIEATGSQANTFRIKSTGCAGSTTITSCKAVTGAKVSSHVIVATFQVKGFLNYVYFTNHEIEDPALYKGAPVCGKDQAYFPETAGCSIIQFATGDAVKGPMHTNDAVCVGGSASFGREAHTPADTVEFYRGLNTNCHGSGKYNTVSGKFIKGESLIPPESDSSLETYALEENEFAGVTHLVLNGSTNTITVTNKGVTKTIPWPTNGLIWIKSPEEEGHACGYKYETHEADNKYEVEHETYCGNVYVSGTYSQSLTVGASDDVIINGSIYPTSVTGKLGTEPSGTATLGLIANNYVRIYHPVEETYAPTGGKCKETYGVRDKETSPGSGVCEYTNEESNYCDAPNASGSLASPWIYAAVLSTLHSFIVDNYSCGAGLENLNVFGAIAQNYRGIVGTSGSTGYIKNYNYDGRLAVDEPPYFLSPLKAGWKVVRETAETAG